MVKKKRSARVTPLLGAVVPLRGGRSDNHSGNNGEVVAPDREREVLRLYWNEPNAQKVARLLGTKAQAVRSELTSMELKLGNGDLRPHWDRKTRQLSFGGLLVYRIRRPARIVEMILDAFAEEGWSARIDDPLPPLVGRREADRLRKEIYAMNRRLNPPLIHFFLDGTGQGVCWELSKQPIGRRLSK